MWQTATSLRSRFALGLVILLACTTVAAQRFRPPESVYMPPDIVPDLHRDAMKVDPLHFKVELENEQIRVLRANLGRGETIPLHDSRTGLVVALTECHLRFIRVDGHRIEVHLEAGKVRWVYADAYSTVNLSNAPAEYLFIETRSND